MKQVGWGSDELASYLCYNNHTAFSLIKKGTRTPGEAVCRLLDLLAARGPKTPNLFKRTSWKPVEPASA